VQRDGALNAAPLGQYRHVPEIAGAAGRVEAEPCGRPSRRGRGAAPVPRRDGAGDLRDGRALCGSAGAARTQSVSQV
jgi:hypothetical protein